MNIAELGVNYDRGFPEKDGIGTSADLSQCSSLCHSRTDNDSQDRSSVQLQLSNQSTAQISFQMVIRVIDNGYS